MSVVCDQLPYYCFTLRHVGALQVLPNLLKQPEELFFFCITVRQGHDFPSLRICFHVLFENRGLNNSGKNVRLQITRMVTAQPIRQIRWSINEPTDHSSGHIQRNRAPCCHQIEQVPHRLAILE